MSRTYGQTMSNHFAGLSNAILGLAHSARMTSAPPPPASPVESDLAGGMTFTRIDDGAECRIQILGALDIHSAPEMRSVFASVLAARPELVTLDLEGLTMLDSSGVGAIVSLFKRVKAAGGRIKVKGVKNQPLAVCKLLKLDRAFGL